MKKRILFVDDEPMVLDALRRMLRSMRGEWDMSFVNSGAEALDHMSTHTVDVVVADMRMPGMNGAQLLEEVMKRHPQTVRLILSGHADKELILQCVGSTHQYLAKPCNPDALKSTICRASGLEGSLRNDSLKRLVGHMCHLPSIPALYTEIVEKTREHDTALEDVARIIARDPGMTAKILKLVNSAFFGLRRELSSAEEAVAYIGLDTIKALVLSLHAFAQFDRITSKEFSVDSLWRHSLHVAAWAKHIAAIERAEQRIAEEAFTAGILHDTGKLILVANVPEQFEQAVALARHAGTELCVAENETLGTNHADLAGYLLGLWGLPPGVVEAIALHHQPDPSADSTLRTATIVHAANVLAHESGGGLELGAVPQLDPAVVETLGGAPRIATWRQTFLENSSTTNRS